MAMRDPSSSSKELSRSAAAAIGRVTGAGAAGAAAVTGAAAGAVTAGPAELPGFKLRRTFILNPPILSSTSAISVSSQRTLRKDSTC